MQEELDARYGAITAAGSSVGELTLPDMSALSGEEVSGINGILTAMGRDLAVVSAYAEGISSSAESLKGLAAGMEKLKTGVSVLSEGSTELTGGLVLFQSALDKAAEGSDELSAALRRVASAGGELDSAFGELVDGMADADASKMLSEMDPDDAAELVSELDYEKAEKLLRLMGVKEQAAIRQLLGYREGTAGRIMTQEFLALDEGATVADAAKAIRSLDEDFESVRYVYLVDEEQHLTGAVTLIQLIQNEVDAALASFAETELVTASAEDDQEDVAEDIAKYNLLAMPVVDDDGKLIGIVTVDDALEVMEEEHEEDLVIVGGDSLGTNAESENVFTRLVSHESWFFLWVIALGVLMAFFGDRTGSVLNGLLLVMGLPIALRTANDMVRYVVTFYLDHDEDDEDTPSMLGFALRGMFSGAVHAAIVYLVVYGVTAVLEGVGLPPIAGEGFVGGAALTNSGPRGSFARKNASLRWWNAPRSA